MSGPVRTEDVPPVAGDAPEPPEPEPPLATRVELTPSRSAATLVVIRFIVTRNVVTSYRH